MLWITILSHFLLEIWPCAFPLLLEQERLEKEKKLSKDLGQAATKLQQLLKATQEQLTKERDTVRTLQEHLEGQVREHKHTCELKLF